MKHWKALVWIFCAVRCLWAASVEVVLDPGDATGAFFLSSPDEPGGVEASSAEPSRRFALTFSSRITVVAQFGPFSVRQTVYAASPLASVGNQSSSSSDGPEPMGDVTAHLVTPAPRRDQPTLRILFHTGSEVGGPSVCVALYAQLGPEQLVSVCQPNRDGACLAELTLPAAWWPPLWAAAHKAHRPTIALRYALVRSSVSQECQGQSLRLSTASVPSNSAGLSLGRLPLSVAHGSYEELSGGDGVVCLLVPQGPVYPRSKVYVPLLVRPNPAYPLHSFTIRAKVKPGLRILQVQPTAKQSWNVAVDTNSKQTSATVTVTRLSEDTALPESGEEVLNWLFEVEEGLGHEDGGQVTWQLRYLDLPGSESTATVSSTVGEVDDSIKLTSRLDIHKDDVQAVLLVAKSNQLLNTAVLTGKQVSQPMKVFVVSQSGLLGDVTLQSSCHSADESVLKVSPSCTSVYLDGSEVRGSQNATVLVKYGTYTGQAAFLVWMPELPLDLRLSDTKLSQIRAWRTPHRHKRCRNPLLQGTVDCRNNWLRNKRRILDKWDDGDGSSSGGSPGSCRLRFQQARVEVLTRFQSVDHNSGREAYLLGRRTQVAVTRLVTPFLRVADAHLASLRGTTVRGLRAGRTEVQVLSPITGKVLGASELRVSTDKESLVRLEVQLVTGLSLEVLPDDAAAGVFVAKTSTSHALTSLYQEGLLDVTLRFSDGTWTPLIDVPESDFSLVMESLDPGVVALAPVAASSGGMTARPRIVAIGQGQGSLLQLSLELGEACQRRRRGAPLAWARARVNARFNSAGAGGSLDAVPYQDGARHLEPSVQAHHNRAALSADGSRSLMASPLELGLYALLGVLGLAAAVMVTGCTVLAVKYQKHADINSTTVAVQPAATAAPPSHPRRPVSSAHDWVWLGRATLERSSVNTRCSQALVAPEDQSKSPPTSLPYPATTGRITVVDNNNPTQSTGEDLAVTKKGGAQPRIRTNPMLTFTRPPPVPPHRTTSRTSPATDSLQNVPLLGHGNGNGHHQRALSPHIRIQSPSSKIASSGSKTTSPDSKTTSPGSRTSPDTKSTSPGGSKTTSPESKSTSPSNRSVLPPICKVVKARANGKAVAGSTLEWEDVTKGMNYDQLVEYFDSLKESSA
ncbi:transmembrane protein 132E-like [Rhipicephalus sanguineus]|uniref:transmembrane protein 132E-like n=1 Tax=Rhipicephalus sanguineus TaxID=34632 RepID=UPI001893B155|nr:transmembrane protein 132E-like [Rhipicephalus sanguineus]